MGSTHELGQSMVAHGTILLHVGRTDEARAYLEEAVKLLRQAGAAADQLQAEQLLATAAIPTHLKERPL
jgi:hypothetical protein